jgi:hypothetical protein
MRRTPQSYENGELVIVFDCADLTRSARFWADALGYIAKPATSTIYRSLIPRNGQGIEVLPQRTSDDKPQKNRLHLDLRTADLTRRSGGSSASAPPCSPITK